MIPAKKMMAIFKTDVSTMKIKDIEVVNISEQTPEMKQFPGSMGACDIGWMGGKELDTPLGLYVQLSVLRVFENRDVAIKAAKEFSKVEGQNWANDLANRIEN